MLLVENVTLTVAPIREILHIGRLSEYRLAIIIILLNLFFLRNHFEVLVSLSCRRAQVHSVWINNFGLFLQVE